MKNKIEKYIPKSIKDYRSWEVSRRNFVKSSLALGALAQLGIFSGCETDFSKSNQVLNTKQLDLVIAVQNILFPKDVNGPGAIDFNAHKYLVWVLSDTRLDPDENNYVINGLKWLEETAQEENNQAFLQLTKKEQVALIHHISTTNWGESWLSVMLTLIFEAMISDPIYGFNKNEIGREWLQHEAGFPRPTKETRYDEIFNLVKNNKG